MDATIIILVIIGIFIVISFVKSIISTAKFAIKLLPVIVIAVGILLAFFKNA